MYEEELRKEQEAAQPDPYFQNDDDLEEERLDDIPVQQPIAAEPAFEEPPPLNNQYNFGNDDDVQEIEQIPEQKFEPEVHEARINQPPSQSVESSDPNGLEFQVSMDPNANNDSRQDRSTTAKKKKKKKKKKVESVQGPTEDELQVQAQLDEERIRQEQEALEEQKRKMEMLA